MIGERIYVWKTVGHSKIDTNLYWRLGPRMYSGLYLRLRDDTK